MQGVKQSVYPSVVIVVVVVGTKIARSRVLGVCACCKHNQSVDIVLYGLQIAQKGLLVLQIEHFLCSMPVFYRPHPFFSMLMQLRMLKLRVGKGRQVTLPQSVAVLRYSGYRARGVCALQSSSCCYR